MGRVKDGFRILPTVVPAPPVVSLIRDKVALRWLIINGGEFLFVNAICPGMIETAEEAGELVAFLASDESKYVTGTPILIDGGSTMPGSGVFSHA
jgi:hypothetical protein